MNLSGRASALVKHWALMAGLGAAVLAVALSGLGFLMAGYFIYLAQHFGAPAAAAITGSTLLVLTILLGLAGAVTIKKLKKPQPSLLSEFSGTLGLGMRLASLIVRRDPKKAIIIAAISGALAEFIMSDNRK